MSLNVILIKNLRPEMSTFIEPAQIDMGFYTQNEILSMKNGNYTGEDRSIGKLSDVLFSEDK